MTMKNLKYVASLLILVLSLQIHAQEELTVGDKAPTFVSEDQNGDTFNLKNALKDGPVIISFYRGSWCPYCMKQLKEVEARYNEITDKKAQFVAVTPDKVSGIEKTVKRINPSFKIIRDADLNISNLFKAISEEKFNSFERELDNSHKFLPVPATYVIGTDGRIKFSYFDANYKIRAHFDEMVQSLK